MILLPYRFYCIYLSRKACGGGHESSRASVVSKYYPRRTLEWKEVGRRKELQVTNGVLALEEVGTTEAGAGPCVSHGLGLVQSSYP